MCLLQLVVAQKLARWERQWRVRTVVPGTSDDGTVVSTLTTVTSKGKGIPLQALTDC